ncbi:MAG: hypothetical protein HKN47_16605 [Pirellulaceae bacterium]|nr:hypothetical protein [Pirellulaceae bacterium]
MAGSLCGGSLSRVQLRPWSLPYSFFKPDPWPSVTLWAGPVLGCLGPVVAASIWRRSGLWLIAWFCVLANGTYLLMGWYAGDGELDSTKIIAAGTPTWLLLMVSVAMTVVGYVGFRQECAAMLKPAGPRMKKRTAAISLGALILLVAVQSAVAMLIDR